LGWGPVWVAEQPDPEQGQVPVSVAQEQPGQDLVAEPAWVPVQMQEWVAELVAEPELVQVVEQELPAPKVRVHLVQQPDLVPELQEAHLAVAREWVLAAEQVEL
jgi:hypothetical protein